MNNSNTTIVLFGATGDLVSRKVLPALYGLEMEDSPIADSLIAFTRRDITTAEFLSDYVRPAVEKVYGTLDEGVYERFALRFCYVQGDYGEKESFERLAEKLRENNTHLEKNELFYLPLHPAHLCEVAFFLKEAGLVEGSRNNAQGWRRVVVEKPFGENKESAENLFASLRTIFAEDDIYCLDHYLGKPILKNIGTLRRDNVLIRDIVESSTIQRIHVRIFESAGVEERGAFYDSVGAFIDVGQSHAIEMFAHTFSSLTSATDASSSSRADALAKLKVLDAREVGTQTIRAQYEGYKNIRNVKENSTTETYFRIESVVTDDDERDISVVLEGGKGLGVINQKEIEVCFGDANTVKYCIHFRLDPLQTVEIETLEDGVVKAVSTAMLRDHSATKQYTEEYALLFNSAVTLVRDEAAFLSPSEVLLLWSFVDPIVTAWRNNKSPLRVYSKNTIPQVH
jgi:glucose-6-phosphate 1-dehydrogenase